MFQRADNHEYFLLQALSAAHNVIIYIWNMISLMRKPLCTAPDDFSVSPLLALLPRKGNAGKLSVLGSSLYARFEKVAGLRREIGDSADKAAIKRLSVEEAMLRQVLEWLEMNIQGS